MKFASYLDNAQAPEWKRAYIDYRGLKKRITAIKQDKESSTEKQANASSESVPSASSDQSGSSTAVDSCGDQIEDLNRKAGGSSRLEVTTSGSASLDTHSAMRIPMVYGQDSLSPVTVAPERQPFPLSPHHPRGPRPREGRNADRSSRLEVTTSGLASLDTHSATRTPMVYGQDTVSPVALEIQPSPLLPRRPRGPRPQELRKRFAGRCAPSLAPSSRSRLLTLSVTRLCVVKTPSLAPPRPLMLSEILEPLLPVELEFFDKLNLELSKVEHFFIEREAEARVRSLELREQLEELKDHQRLFQEAHPGDRLPKSTVAFLAFARPNAPKSYRPQSAQMNTLDAIEGHISDPAVKPHTHRFSYMSKLNADEYLPARKQLKRAVTEHYHALEVLNNYRILNITGFRKSLKKFEKVTGVLVQDIYMKEKVDPCVFMSDDLVQALLKEMEDLFAASFARGDRKSALVHLRAVPSHKTHHSSTFRAGLALGLAFSALIDAMVRCSQQQTRSAMPSWETLLYIYGIFQVPTLFAVLVGTNILIWNASRINYVFIFELDTRTLLDHREYLEIPCIAFATLCWAFWFSLARVGVPTIQPWTWPMIWLFFVVLLLVNPLPVMSRASRWWFLREVARLLLSGSSRGGFKGFWIADQLCSLVFPLGNIYFVACSYARGFHPNSIQECGNPALWAIPFVLGVLPFVARIAQSIRRWLDSQLIMHLINAGKYLTGIVYYMCYYVWRHQGAGRGTSFVFFCLLGIIYSIYASSWDLLMDWSLLRPHARFKFLRQELLYSNSIPFYYLAIITNVLIRFIWVIYIPKCGPSLALRAWIVALLEVLRRCQWNVYRLENEQIGNMDQYRITREVPLPYSLDEVNHKMDVGDEDNRAQDCGSVRSFKSKKDSRESLSDDW